MSPRGRAAGARDFLLQRLPPVLFLDSVVSHTFCVPEDAASPRVPASVSSSELSVHHVAPSIVIPHKRSRPALELDARGNFSTSTKSISVPTTSHRFSENLFHDFFHHLWYGKVSTEWESRPYASNAAESAPESTNTIPQFVLESED